MALIAEFLEAHTDRASIHGPVQCGWRVFESGGVTILQLDTYGSDQRKIPDKVSQTIQLNREGAQVLLSLIRRAFPDLR